MAFIRHTSWSSLLVVAAACSGGPDGDTQAGAAMTGVPGASDSPEGNDPSVPGGTPDDDEGMPDDDLSPPTTVDDSEAPTPLDPDDPSAPVDDDGDPSTPPSAADDDPATTPGEDVGVPVTCEEGVLELGTSPLRRLSSREYLNTLSDLFPGISPDLPELPVEAPVDSFDNDARALGPSDLAVSRWEDIAFRYTNDLLANDEAFDEFLPCAADVSDESSAQQCGAELIDGFGERAHRRPLSEEERPRYQTLFDAQLAAIDFEAAVQLTMMAMLQSPWLLYRVEVAGSADATDVAPLDSFEMASRLSYFLWQTMPDETLMEAARQDLLTDPTEIEAQTRRMLEDPRARAAVGDFHRQWLFFDRILKEEHDTRVPDLFPDWSAESQFSAHEELLRFAEHSVLDGEGTLADLLLSREAEVNGPLADIYGVDGPEDANDWQMVTLPEGERAGILTRVGFLAAHSHSANGSPPLRGNYVMQRLFCMDLPPPPPDADTSPPDSAGTALTNREAFAERTAPDTCQSCHTVLDAFGFGFEHYDAVGAYRDEDNGKPVDAVVTLPGTDLGGEVNGALELSQSLVDSAQVKECVVSRWFRYSRGRGVEGADACALEPLNQRFEESSGNFIELIVALSTSPEFRSRTVGED
jgi:hypothetical protein